MEIKHQRVRRDYDRDLTFRGQLIGVGDYGTGGNSGASSDWTRGTEVEIYLIHPSGKLVTSVRQWSKWTGEEDSHRAAVHTDPEAAYDWLVADCNGKLGRASKDAWEEACETCPELAGADVEEVI